MNSQTPRLHVDVEVRRGAFALQVAFGSEGDVLVLFGPSGSGKSTTLQAIAGLVAPTTGEITLNGETLFRRGREGSEVNVPARSRRVGYVFQDYALFPHLTAAGNVAYSRWRKPDAHRRASEVLDRVGLAGFEDRYPHQLSGGQQQRVAIARALAAGPAVLLLDEPFSALDLETRREVRSEVRRVLEEARLPVVLVTHDREEALALGDRVVVLDAGRVVADGDPIALLGHSPRERVARLLGVENLLRLEVLEVAPSEGVMHCGRSEFRLDVPLSDGRPGDELTVGLRADDVLLASVRPVGLSARNIIPGTVGAVRSEGAMTEVVLDCSAQVALVSHVTHAAVRELNIVPGAQLWAVVKTASCVVLRE